MRSSIIIAAACAFGFVSAQQFQGNGTIFQILNKTDGSSPAPQLAQFLQSSSDYQPIIDLLNDPTNNLTMFVPSDGLFYNITGQTPPIIKQVTTTIQTTIKVPASTVRVPASTVTLSPSTVTARAASATSRPASVAPSFGMSDIMSILRTQQAAKPTQQAKYIRLDRYDDTSAKNYFVSEQEEQVIKALAGIRLAHYENTQQNGPNFTNVSTSPYTNDFSVLDLLYYHILNGSVTLQNNETAVYNTFLTNATVDRSGFGSPLLVQPVNSTGNLTVGDGLGNDAYINSTYNASNGMIYIIDKVLIPPVNISSTLNVLSNASFFKSLLERTNSTFASLNNYNNFTIFAPDNNALQNVDLSTLNDDTINNLVSAHIFQGVIYSSNITNTTNVNAQSLAGTDVILQRTGNSPNFTVNGTNVVQPNILLNNGVMHLIDGVLSFPASQSQPQPQPQPLPQESNPSDEGPFTSETPTDTTNTPTETATEVTTALAQTNTPTPTHKLSSATVPTLASTLVLLSSTFVFYFLYV